MLSGDGQTKITLPNGAPNKLYLAVQETIALETMLTIPTVTITKSTNLSLLWTV